MSNSKYLSKEKPAADSHNICHSGRSVGITGNVSLGGTAGELPVKVRRLHDRGVKRYPDTGRLPDDPLSTLGVTSAKVQKLRVLCAELQVATVNLGTRYLELVQFLRTNPVTEHTGRTMMAKAGLNRQRISEIYRVVRAPEAVVDAFQSRLIGFKAAVKIARLKEGAKLTEPDNHRARERKLYEAWKRFHEEWAELEKFTMEYTGEFPSSCYLDWPKRLIPSSWEDEDLPKGVGTVRFQYGRCMITICPLQWTDEDTKDWIDFEADGTRRVGKVPMPPYRMAAAAVRAELKRRKKNLRSAGRRTGVTRALGSATVGPSNRPGVARQAGLLV